MHIFAACGKIANSPFMQANRVIYLHGFASSPASRKANLFLEKLSALRIPVEAPALAPHFEHLTITSQIAIIDSAVRSEPVVLVGSSLGGYLAALYAVGHANVQRLVLLAPAFGFYQLWADKLGLEGLEDWRKNRTISVYHYGKAQNVPLDFGFMEDAQRYQPYPDFLQPCQILHGLKDTVVPYENSARFAESHPNAQLLPLDSGHEMTDVLDEIWKTSSTFLLQAVRQAG